MKTSRHHAKAALLGAALSGLMMVPAVAQEKNPERNVYFGEQHVHTSWSNPDSPLRKSSPFQLIIALDPPKLTPQDVKKLEVAGG